METEVNRNIGCICTALQCRNGLDSKTALRWIDVHGKHSDYTFGDLERRSNRFANVVTMLGINRGDTFFTFLPKMPEQFFAFLGALKAQAVTSFPLP